MSFLTCFPAFKQSPPAIPALGANVKKRRHGDEDMFYMHVSDCQSELGRTRPGGAPYWKAQVGEFQMPQRWAKVASRHLGWRL